MNQQAVLEGLDADLQAWRINGMNGPPEERSKFLNSCFHAARLNMRFALLATPILRPGKTQREVFDEIVPKVIEYVVEQGRSSGYTDEQVQMYLEAHQRAYRALAGEFGFVEMTQEEIESLKEF